MPGPEAPIIYTIAILLLVSYILIKAFIFIESLRYTTFASYYKQKALMTPTEKRFFYALVQAVKGEYMILSKVRAGDVIGVKANNNKEGNDFWNLFDPLTRMHADFVLCAKSTTEPILVIELDDRTHNKAKSIKNDKIKNKAYKRAHMPILRTKPQTNYNLQELSDKIHVAIETYPS